MSRAGRLRGAAAIAALAAVAALAFVALGVASPGDLVLVSQTGGGSPGNGTSTQPDMTKDGRFVAFLSSAQNLTGAGNPRQAFVRDVVSGTTTLVSVGADGTTPANAAVDTVTISDDGRRIAFHSRATNLVASATAAAERSYVRDLDASTTTLVAASPNDDAVEPAISGDGQTVAFVSHAHYDGLNSVSLQTYVRDVGTPDIHAVSTGMIVAETPAISESGRYVAVRGQQNGVSGVQVFLCDRVAGTTTLVSRRSGAAGDPGTTASDEPAISADGRFVVFRSSAENLSDDDQPDHSATDVYERDMVQNTTTLVSRADGPSGAPPPYPANSGPGSVSDDGRLVAFVSSGTNLAPVSGTNGESQSVYLRDLDAGTTRLMSAKTDGSAPPSGGVDGVSMSGDGTFAAFASSAGLMTGVTGTQVYRRELGTPAAPPPPPNVAIADAATVTEGGPGQVTQAAFTISLDQPSAKPVTVAWSTADGTATGGSDFRTAAGQVVFDPGHTTATVAVDVLGDNTFEGDESFQVTLHDAVNAVLGRAAATAKIADDDPPPPPDQPPGLPTGNGGLAATSGPPIADCPNKLTRGWAHLTGCFSGDTARGKVALNGLLIAPLASSTTITATASRISSSAPVLVTAGDVAVSRGVLDLDPTVPTGAAAGLLTPAAGSSVYGLGFDPKMALVAGINGAVTLRGQVSPRFGTVLGTPIDVMLPVDEGSGLHRDRITAGAPASLVGNLVTTDLRFAFVPAANEWTGSITVSSPFFDAMKIAALIPGAGLLTGAIQAANRVAQKLITFRTLDLKLLTNPLRLSGTVDAVAGPFDMLGFAGTVTDDLSSGEIGVVGTARLFGIPLQVPPKIDLGGAIGGVAGRVARAIKVIELSGNMHGTVPAAAPSAPVDMSDIPFHVFGGLLGNGMFLAGDGHGHVKILGAEVGAQLAFSEKGFAGCGQIGPIQAGFGVTWKPFKVDVMGPFVCDVGPWRSSAAAAQAGGARSVSLGRGKQLVRFVGDTAPPEVILSGPGGRTVTTPAADQPPLVTRDVAILRDPATRTTYVALADGGGGRWTVTTRPGSATVTGVSAATMLPPAKVTARLAGRGDARTLRWRATGMAGRRVRFDERGAGVLHRLGEVGGTHGTLRFTPALGGGRRTIVATVLQAGRPTTSITVARYTAPRPAGGGRVRSLAVTLAARKVTVRWSRVPGAARYLVKVRTGLATTVRVAGATATRLTISTLTAPATATATVIATDAAGHRGPPRTATARARRR